MEPLLTGLEIAKKAVETGAAEAVKVAETAETVMELSENTRLELGRLGTPELDSRISFGSLANGEFKRDANYLAWKDGIDAGEVEPEWIERLTNEISEIYGEEKLEVVEVPGFYNAGMQIDKGRLFYGSEYFEDNGNEHGEDLIIGAIAHEVGHRVVDNLGLTAEITDYEHEACADYIAGLTARLCKLDRGHLLSWYGTRSEFSRDGEHPGSAVRIEILMRGLTRIDRGAEASVLRTFENFSPYDLGGIYKDSGMLKSILYEDVLAPLRTGEIKKI